MSKDCQRNTWCSGEPAGCSFVPQESVVAPYGLLVTECAAQIPKATRLGFL